MLDAGARVAGIVVVYLSVIRCHLLDEANGLGLIEESPPKWSRSKRGRRQAARILARGFARGARAWSSTPGTAVRPAGAAEPGPTWAERTRPRPGTELAARGPIGNIGGGPRWMTAKPSSPLWPPGPPRWPPLCAPRMKPEKKITATMNTTPATMPTQAAAAVTLERRGSSRTATGARAAGWRPGRSRVQTRTSLFQLIDQILQPVADVPVMSQL